ncbi:sensor histidine kinase [Virgibacillus sp. NKC19-16]|uniref:ATP-binding protein n=1 Tax=Virgibacillus salidurans TaxID=2831673 RepID=UPI001F3CFFA6|nr:sensor histidine kinase [Virgibacillus sp. NKC19-16]UJL47191.1 sensor histidine kinase [Virgibacillus sp. NKC19-16]
MIRFHKPYNKRNLEPNVKVSLKIKMIVLISLLIAGICILFAGFLHIFISNTIEDQVGKRALSVAKTVANMPEVKAAFELEDPASVIQETVAPIREETGAEFIVVGNREGIRYSHPNPERIGEEMIGGDNARALEDGEAYVSRSTGSLGLSIRGKLPVLNEAGDIMGVVSVGFLNEDVQSIIANQSKSLWLTLAGVGLLGIAGAIFIAYYIKKLLSNMEPEEISHLLLQKESILQSAHEGMIAVDRKGIITLMNTAAKHILFGDVQHPDHFSGKPIDELLPGTALFDVLESGESHYDKEMILGKSVVLVNQVPVYMEGTIEGAVSTFRKKTEMEHMTRELQQIKQYANAQRAQTHEFSNKLYTILGLLQLGEKQEAIEFIKKEKNIQQERSEFLTQQVKDSVAQGLLQGKINQVNELGISLSIHPDSQLSQAYHEDTQEALLTGLGNLLENAIESVKNNQEGDRRISLFFTDIGDDIVVEVDDSGSGISEANMPHIFEQGFSTKEKGKRGSGLSLTRHIVHKSGGEVMLEEGEMRGACFVMIIPKNRRKHR